MSRLDDAKDRLEQAVNRLELAITDSQARNAVGSDESRLASDLAAAKRDFQKLSSATDQVSDRLDNTIGRLKTMLEA